MPCNITQPQRACYSPSMPRLLPYLSIALVASAAGEAGAQSTLVQARGSLGISYTDNALSAPQDARADDPARQDDVFFLFTPSLVIFHETPRLQLLAMYEHPLALFVTDASADNASDKGSFSAVYAASSVDSLILSTSISRATTRQTTVAAPELSTVGTQLSGDNTLLTLNLTESLTHDFSEAWRGVQDFGTTVVFPLETAQRQSTRWLASANFAGDYRRGEDAFGLLTNHASVFTAGVEGDQGADSLLVNGLSARWRRDIAPFWTSQLVAGITSAYGVNSERFYLGPTWGASFGFSDLGYTLNLGYSRGIVPNVVAGPTSLTDTLQLVGAMPVVEGSNVVLHGSVGASYNQLLEAEAFPSSTVFAWVNDIALSWTPPTLPSFSLRYQHIQQFEPSEENLRLRPFNTNTATLTMSYQFPNANVPRVRLSPSRRVDAADATPLDPGPSAGPAGVTSPTPSQ